jgi:hypothetical protein
MAGLLLIAILSLPSAAFGQDDEIRVVERRELPARHTGSHALQLSLHVFRGGRWSPEEAEAAVLEAAGLLRQCGLALSRAELRVVQAPGRFRVYFTPVSRELLARLPAPRPAVFFVDDTRNDPAFDAEAIGRENAAGLPQVLAHELVHLLSDSGSHSEAPGNLMRAETSPGATRLTPAQCERLRARGQANGLLGVN